MKNLIFDKFVFQNLTQVWLHMEKSGKIGKIVFVYGKMMIWLFSNPENKFTVRILIK